MAALVASFWTTFPMRADDAEDEKLFNQVMARLVSSKIASVDYPGKYIWPPKYFIKPDSKKELNAYATAHPKLGAVVDKKAGKIQPVVMITQGFMKEIIKGDENVLAVIMGHELAHIQKDHVSGQKGDTSLLVLAFGRDEEIEADLQGMKFALAAGFPYKTAIRNTIRQVRRLPKYTSFEGLGSSHPTWEERLALLDKNQAVLWSAMTAFTNGNGFLQFEQYLAAEQCFRAVVKEFPECHEAWANLGYARLMRYCDGLDSDDLKRYDLGHIVAGGFYSRPDSLESKVRGIDEKLWKDAVQALNKALTLKPDLALPRSSLGLAYLVHPEGKDGTKAAKWFADALARFNKDPELRKNHLSLAALLINAGVADLAGGQPEKAADKFKEAEKVVLSMRLTRLVKTEEDALLYNRGLAAVASKDADQKRQGCRLLEAYLLQASPDSSWWSLAFERYQKLSKDLGLKALERGELSKGKRLNIMRILASVAVGSESVTLSEPLKDAVERLGKKAGVAVPLYPGAKIVRWHFTEQGIDLLGKDKVLAIFLKNPKAPPVVLQAAGVAAKPQKLHVGMTEKEAEAVLKDQRADPAPRFIDNLDVRYRFYPELGLAVRVADGLVVELALAQIPRRSFFNVK
jgi:predicted Zn-dependent protease